MFLRRLTFLLTCAALLACRILSGYPVFGALLLAFILMACVSFGLFLYASSAAGAEIHVPETAKKNEDLTVTILLKGHAVSGLMNLTPSGQISNRLTGEQVSFRNVYPVSDSSGTAVSFNLNSPHCGLLSARIESIRITDPLGLFLKERILDVAAETLILPDTFDVSADLTTPDLPDIESNDYSLIRPGDDPGELFDIRDYREGDPMKQIHWKLSEKYDRTVIREMSLPVAHSLLLLFDNCPESKPVPDACSDAAEALISLSQSLIDQSVPHRIAWFDQDSGLMSLHTVSGSDDLLALQSALLSCRVIKSAENGVSRLLEQGLPEYSRLLYFATQEPDGLDALSDTTLLLPQADPERGVSCLRGNFEAIIL